MGSHADKRSDEDTMDSPFLSGLAFPAISDSTENTGHVGSGNTKQW